MTDLNKINSVFVEKLKTIKSKDELQHLKTEFFGKSGEITNQFKKLGLLEESNRKEFASKLNKVKESLTNQIEIKNKSKTDSITLSNSPNVTPLDLEQSCLNQIHKLITENGGSLHLYKMPLHSIVENSFNSDNAQQNIQVFERWLKQKGIPIINNNKFKFSDKDLTDYMHLNDDRRDEFTSLLYQKMIDLKIIHTTN